MSRAQSRAAVLRSLPQGIPGLEIERPDVARPERSLSAVECGRIGRTPPALALEITRGSFRAEPPHPRPNRAPANGPRSGGAPDDQSPRPGVRGDARSDPDGDEAVLRNDERRGDADL